MTNDRELQSCMCRLMIIKIEAVVYVPRRDFIATKSGTKKNNGNENRQTPIFGNTYAAQHQPVHNYTMWWTFRVLCVFHFFCSILFLLLLLRSAYTCALFICWYAIKYAKMCVCISTSIQVLWITSRKSQFVGWCFFCCCCCTIRIRCKIAFVVFFCHNSNGGTNFYLSCCIAWRIYALAHD